MLLVRRFNVRSSLVVVSYNRERVPYLVILFWGVWQGNDSEYNRIGVTSSQYDCIANRLKRQMVLY